MRKALYLAAFLGISVTTGAVANEPEAALGRAPSDMSGAEIDAYNQGRASTAADFIRCRRLDESGSLVKKPRVCKTNAEWKRYADKGNQDARDSMETLARGWTNPQEPAGSITYTQPPK